MAKKKPDPQTPLLEETVTKEMEDMQFVSDLHRNVEDARELESKKKAEFQAARERRKQAEADREAGLSDVLKPRPLFDKPKGRGQAPPHPETVEAGKGPGVPADGPAPAAPPADAAPAAEAPAAAPGPPQGDESWRARSLADFLLPDGILDILNRADLFTVGQYSDWCKTPGNHLDKIKGLGPNKLAKLADAEIVFWERWRAGDFAPPPVVPAPAPEFDDAAADAVIGDASSAEAAADAVPGPPAEPDAEAKPKRKRSRKAKADAEPEPEPEPEPDSDLDGEQDESDNGLDRPADNDAE